MPSLPGDRGVNTLPPVTFSAPDPGYQISPPSSPRAVRPAVGDCVTPGCEQPEDPFHFLTGSGGAWSGFPRTLLWEPPLASLREPRFMAMPNNLTSDVSQQTVDTAIGNTLGLLRYESAGKKWAWQFDAFAVVYSRFSEYDYFVASDYRVGLPVTFSCGPWHGKIGYEHTSTHLGDETIARTGRTPFDYIKDELVMGLGRYFWDQQFRVYGQAAWAFYQQVPGDPSPWRFDLGSEWVRRRATGCCGQPFMAGNLDFNGAVDYSPSLSLQAGWLWRDPSRRLAQARVFAQYFTGYSLYGQFFRTREEWFGGGFAVDY